MSRYLHNYINLLFHDSKNESFVFYLNEDDLYLTNSLDGALEKLSERLKEKYGKLPNFRSATKEAIAKYNNTIKYFEEKIKEDSSDVDSLKSIISIYKYKVYLIKSKFGKNTKNTILLRKMAADFIKKKFPHLKNIENKYFYNENFVDLKVIKSLNDYININNNIQKQITDNQKNNMYFRGHSNYNFELIPSIYRENFISNEHKMFRDILIRNPEEFTHAKSTFEKLTIMQHYGLPTRLLDVTKNPLVALFFACEKTNNENNPAEVLIFCPNDDDIKYYDSDTVCILSNISKCERSLVYVQNQNFNLTSEGKKLLHLIKEDKPHFTDDIKQNDFNRVLIVKPINNNNRVKRQSGHFFIFGFDKEIKNPAKLNCFLSIKKKRIKILVDPTSLKSIINELKNININKESLFPEIENGTAHIKENYNQQK